jgi:hypothetical protein
MATTNVPTFAPPFESYGCHRTATAILESRLSMKQWSLATDAAGVRETQAFSGIAMKPPISAAVTGPINSSVFRHAVLRTRLPYVLAECGLGL